MNIKVKSCMEIYLHREKKEVLKREKRDGRHEWNTNLVPVSFSKWNNYIHFKPIEKWFRKTNKKKSVHFCGNAGKFTFHFQKNTFKVCLVFCSEYFININENDSFWVTVKWNNFLILWRIKSGGAVSRTLNQCWLIIN